MAVTLTTSLGDLKLELYADEAPLAVENFLALAASGFFDRTQFHRVIKGFCLQGGDKTGTGKVSKSVWGGKFSDELSDHLRFEEKGVLAMATSGPNKNGSQFFITFDRAAHLNHTCTIFGRVVWGIDVLDKIEKVPVDSKFRPLQPINLLRVKIHANPIAEQATAIAS